jgi:Zn-dependent protease with chaperone function
MLTGIPGLTLLVATLAVVPAVVCWWQGRRLARMVDDAALPERLMAARQRTGAVFGAAIVLLLVASTDHIWWSLPLAVLALIVAAFPLRVALFEETWSLSSYTWFTVRLFVGVWGFWIVLLVMPMAASYAGTADFAIAAVLGTGLVLWNVHYAALLRWILSADRVESPVLMVRFVEMVRRAGIEPPRFDRVDLRGGTIANALALPSLKGSGVLFSQTLLERLTEDEVVAICAHELAHLEHYNRRRLRRLYAANIVFIVTGAAITPVSRLAGLPSNLIPLAVWVVALGAEMTWRARDRQRNETASDLRAVELCGNADALVSALTRLYALGRIPRRLEAVHERRATHPSLARRIRDIRAAAGTAGPPLETAARFRAADGSAAVTFDNARLHWHEGDSIVHSIGYETLAELRVDVRGVRPASLLAVERGGRRWSMALDPRDLADVQQALDRVDAQVPEPPPAPAQASPAVYRLVLSFAALASVFCGYLAMTWVALLALVQPAAPLLTAAGLASLAAAGLLVRGGMGRNPPAEVAFVFALLGLVLLLTARQKRGEPATRRAAGAIAALGVFAALATSFLLVGGVDPVRLHQAARSSTAAPILLLALAGALASWRSRIARLAAIPVVVLTAATVAASSSTFLDRFGRDPFLAPAVTFEWRTLPLEPIGVFPLPAPASSIQLSPTGRYAAFAAERPETPDALATFSIGTLGGTWTDVPADEVLFVDDEHVLLVESTRDGIDVRHASARRPQDSIWRVRVGDVLRESLAFDAAGRRWRVMGWDRMRERIVKVEGRIGEAAFDRSEWPVSGHTRGYTHSVAAAGGNALFVENRYETGAMPRDWGWTWWLFPPAHETWFGIASADAIANVATSRIDARCHPDALGGGRLLCSGFDGTRTRFIAIDPASGRIAGVAWLEGQFVASCGSSPGWLCGWLNGSPVALHPERREGLRFAERTGAFEISAADGVAATLDYDANGSIVTLYSTR